MLGSPAILLVGFTHLALSSSADGSDMGMVVAFFVEYGVGCAMFMAAYWPCVRLAVPAELATTAFGVSFCSLNLFSAIGPIIVGMAIDRTRTIHGGYLYVRLLPKIR